MELIRYRGLYIAYIHTYGHMYIHTHIHTHIYTYIHTYKSKKWSILDFELSGGKTAVEWDIKH